MLLRIVHTSIARRGSTLKCPGCCKTMAASVSERGDSFAEVVADRGACEALRSSRSRCRHTVVEAREALTDVAVRGVCELTTSDVERCFESSSSDDPQPDPAGDSLPTFLSQAGV